MSQTPAPVHHQIVVQGSFVGTPWWAGFPAFEFGGGPPLPATYPVPPQVRVLVDGAVGANISVEWTMVRGIVSRETTLTDTQGKSGCPASILNAAGSNTILARVTHPQDASVTDSASFTIPALSEPSTITEYDLVLLDGARPPTAGLVENDIVGGVLFLGDNGTFEWIEYDTFFHTQFPLWGAGTYSASPGWLSLSPVLGFEFSKFPGATATVSGDTINTSFQKVLSVGLDPDTVVKRETYVRVAGPPLSARR